MLGAGIIALSSCSSDETVATNEGNQISFRASLEANAKGEVVTAENLGQFYVSAYGTDNAHKANMFTNLEVTKQEGSRYWTSAQAYYWPEWELQFVAYGPKLFPNNSTINSSVQEIRDFYPHPWSIGQFDLVAANQKGNVTNNAVAGVNMVFNHELSAVRVQAVNRNQNVRYVIHGVRLTYIKTGATLTLPVNTSGSWTTPTRATLNCSSTEDNYILNESVQPIMDGYFFVIPQKLTAWNNDIKGDKGTRLSWLVTVYNVDNTTGKLTQIKPDPTKGKAMWLSTPINQDWTPGIEYVYTLDFTNGGGIPDDNQNQPSTDPEENPDPEDEDDATEKKTDDTPDDVDPEEDGLKPITYTVIVAPFGTTTGQSGTHITL